NSYVISRRLAEEGVTVGLSGLGADELFGGYQQFSRAPQLSGLLRTLAFIPRSIRSGVIQSVGLCVDNRAAVEKLADAVAGDSSVAGVTRAARRLLSDKTLDTLGLRARRLGLAADFLETGDDREDPTLDGDAFNTVSRIEMAHYMRDTLLRDTDANSMRHSLEVRVPFLDLPLVEYVSSLPGRVKDHGRGHGKHLLRHACQTVLSDEVANREKTGFTLPIGAWMQNEMRDSCEAAIDRLATMPFLDGTAVRRLWNGFMANPGSSYWSRPLSLVVLGSQPW
ncbi:MAG: asparagine synthase-related protein, partial [Planctomycetaceae bacterium]